MIKHVKYFTQLDNWSTNNVESNKDEWRVAELAERISSLLPQLQGACYTC